MCTACVSQIQCYHLLVSSAAGNDPISVKSSLSSVGVVDANNELTVIGNNDVFEDEALLIGDCKSVCRCVCVYVCVCVQACVRTCVHVSVCILRIIHDFHILLL